MSKDDRDLMIADLTSSGAIAGTSLKLDNGYAIINGDKYRCTDLTYSTNKTDAGLVLTIVSGDKSFVFLKKKGLGGLFGLSMDIQDFTDKINEHVEIAQKDIENEEHTARIQHMMDGFKTDTYTLYNGGPEGYLLKKGELIAMWSSGVELKQVKTHTVAAATGTSIRIAKGVSWRIGGATPISKEYLAHVDTGRLVITNQKVSFMGDNKSVNIPISKIADVQAFSDAFEVSKEGVLKKYIFMVSHGDLWAECIMAMNRRLNQ